MIAQFANGDAENGTQYAGDGSLKRGRSSAEETTVTAEVLGSASAVSPPVR